MIPGGVDRVMVGGGCVLGAVVLTLCVAFTGDQPPLVFLRLALVTLAAATAFVLDEPAAAAVDAVPRTRRRRTGARLTAVGLPLGVWTAGVSALELRSPVTPAGALLVEGVGVLAVAVAAAAVLRLAGRPEPGELVASCLGAVILALLVFDPPPWWSAPPFPVGHGWVASTVLWVCLTVVAAAGVVVTSRDPYRRRHVR